ncbi:organic cation transporter protein-like [Diadema antillarum]|uniref:organic cation transporter protein-like n=1 Tax=Diadema antillarum TaxID=105358 RepID=UPI003A869DB0
MKSFDDILKEIGEMGPYQWRIFTLLCTVSFLNSWSAVIAVFLNAPLEHWCAVPHWDDYDCSEVGLTDDVCEASKRNASIPSNVTADGILVYEQCHKYNVSGVDFWPGLSPSNYSTGLDDVISCDGGWIYDTSQYKSSIVSEFNLVCGKEDLPDVAQSVYYGGFLAGSFIFGSLADLLGRRWTLIASLILQLAFGALTTISPSWVVYSVLRFFQGVAAIGSYIIAYVLATEFVGPLKRNIVGIAFAIPYALGYILLALIAFFFRDWKTLQLVSSAPITLSIIAIFFVPESVRWLMSQKKYEDAEKILSKVAEVNHKSISRPIFSQEFIKESEASPKERRKTGVDIFRTPRMRIRSLNIIFNWMVNAMVYHGLSLNSSNLGVNDYIAFAISGGVEIPAYLISIFAIEIIGRRLSLCSCLLLGGVACLCTTFIPPGAILTTVAMIGKFGISASFTILYLYTCELYPTEIRSAALGTCSMFSRVASIVAPLILTLDKFWTPLPLVVFGSVTVIAGLLSLAFPETRGKKLPETIEEGENFGYNNNNDNNNNNNNDDYFNNCNNIKKRREKTGPPKDETTPETGHHGGVVGMERGAVNVGFDDKEDDIGLDECTDGGKESTRL